MAARWPAATTLRRWLDRAEAAGLVCVGGAGRRIDPYHYWLPGDEARLLPLLPPLEPLAEIERGEMVREADRVAERALRRRGSR